MNLDNARNLKAELTKEFAVLPLTAAPRRDRAVAVALPDDLHGRHGRVMISYAATRIAELDPLPPTVALGISRRARNDFRIAVRLQRQSLVDGPHVDLIRRRARGEIDVRYIGRLTKRAVPANQRRARPLRIGLSVGHYRITAGTLGAFLVLRGSKEVRMLSNNHVFADENRGKRGDPILQPGDVDGGTNPGDRVGALAEFCRLAKGKTNHVDAALAELDAGVGYKRKTLSGHGQLKGVTLDPALISGTVEKIGRTTGHTKGRITAFDVNQLIVNYDMGNLRFDGQIEIEGVGPHSFSDGGDSGSIIYTSADHLAVGLLFAGGDTGGRNNAGLTYANPIGYVLDRLKVDLLL